MQHHHLRGAFALGLVLLAAGGFATVAVVRAQSERRERVRSFEAAAGQFRKTLAEADRTLEKSRELMRQAQEHRFASYLGAETTDQQRKAAVDIGRSGTSADLEKARQLIASDQYADFAGWFHVGRAAALLQHLSDDTIVAAAQELRASTIDHLGALPATRVSDVKANAPSCIGRRLAAVGMLAYVERMGDINIATIISDTDDVFAFATPDDIPTASVSKTVGFVGVFGGQITIADAGEKAMVVAGHLSPSASGAR